jgi:AsmA-like C-terminal region
MPLSAISTNPVLPKPAVPPATLVLSAVAAVVVLGFAGCAYLLANWPFAEQRLIDALQESSVRTVTIGSFHRTYFPPGCVAQDIRFLHRQDKSKPPLITVRKIVIEGSYLGMIDSPKRLAKVLVQGMHVTVPPDRPDGTNPVMPLTDVNSKRPIVIGTVIADGTVLDFVSSREGREPLQLVLEKLALDGVGNNQPISYRATIQNSEPPGLIESTGRFGPWISDHPGQTAVSGSFTFTHADLGVFKGLSGMLSSAGQFSGSLAHIKISGRCELPNLHVARSAHTENVTSEFQATVNATDGDTVLEQVQSRINRTALVSKGTVSGETGKKGKVVILNVSSADGRIEDFLDTVLSARIPALTGSINLRAKVIIPPEKVEFLRKIELEGDFGVVNGKFASEGTQNALNKLSGSSRPAQTASDMETALSNLKGHIAAKNGLATLTAVSFSIPGADAQIHGTFNLLTDQVDLHGVLRTDGKVWAVTHGFKSLMMHAIAPFLKHKSGTTSVPFKITGKYPDPSISLDLFAKQ